MDDEHSALAAFRRGDNAGAARLAQHQLRASEADDDDAGRVDALCMLARVALRVGDYGELSSRAHDALQVARAEGDRRLQRMPLHMLAVAARMTGRVDDSRALYAQSIILNEELGEAAMAASEHRNLAYVELRAGNTTRARELFDESARRFRSIDSPAMTPYLEFDRATVAFLDGDRPVAIAHLDSARAMWAQQGAAPDPDDARELATLADQPGQRS